MATLHVRNVPEKLYKRLRRLAQGQDQSLSAEAIDLLAEGIAFREAKARQRRILEFFRRNRITLPPGSPTAEELIREDRSR